MIGEGETFLEDPFFDKQYLNLPFRWLMDDGMIVVQDAGQLHRGDQILNLGGQSPDELVRTLRQVVEAQNEY